MSAKPPNKIIAKILLAPTLLISLAFLMFPALAQAEPACVCNFRLRDTLDLYNDEYCLYFLDSQISDVDLTNPENPSDMNRICQGLCTPRIKEAADPDRFSFEFTDRGAWFLADHDDNIGIKAIADCEAEKFDPTEIVVGGVAADRGYIVPTLGVAIPNLTFSQPLYDGKRLTIDFIGQYMSAVYRWLLGASLVIAIVLVMIGGIQYVLSAGSGDVSKAKERITNAVIGFILLLSTYVILYTINPELTLLGPLTLEQVQADPGLPFGEGEEDYITGGIAVDVNDLVLPEGSNIYTPRPASAVVTPDVAEDVLDVAERLKTQGYSLYISSGYRSLEKQLALIRQNCQNPAGSQRCNPFPGRPSTCILRGMDPKNCPHTTGQAIDIWGATKNTKGATIQCINQKDCLGNLTACFNNPCQAAVIAEMKAEGFCVLRSEPWHFEKPKMSRSCEY